MRAAPTQALQPACAHSVSTTYPSRRLVWVAPALYLVEIRYVDGDVWYVCGISRRRNRVQYTLAANDDCDRGRRICVGRKRYDAQIPTAANHGRRRSQYSM